MAAFLSFAIGHKRNEFIQFGVNESNIASRTLKEMKPRIPLPGKLISCSLNHSNKWYNMLVSGLAFPSSLLSQRGVRRTLVFRSDHSFEMIYVYMITVQVISNPTSPSFPLRWRGRPSLTYQSSSVIKQFSFITSLITVVPLILQACPSGLLPFGKAGMGRLSS